MSGKSNESKEETTSKEERRVSLIVNKKTIKQSSKQARKENERTRCNQRVKQEPMTNRKCWKANASQILKEFFSPHTKSTTLHTSWKPDYTEAHENKEHNITLSSNSKTLRAEY